MTASIQQMANRVAELMEARLRIRGDTLAAKLNRGGRRLPRRVLAAAVLLAASAQQAQSPKLQSRLDPERVALAYDTCLKYLRPLDAGVRRRAILWQMTTSVASGLFITLIALAVVLAWRGYL